MNINQLLTCIRLIVSSFQTASTILYQLQLYFTISISRSTIKSYVFIQMISCVKPKLIIDNLVLFLFSICYSLNTQTTSYLWNMYLSLKPSCSINRCIHCISTFYKDITNINKVNVIFYIIYLYTLYTFLLI